MICNIPQRPIDSNWPLFIGCIASLFLHGMVFFACHPDTYHKGQRSLIQIDFRITPPNSNSMQPNEETVSVHGNGKFAKRSGGSNINQNIDISEPPVPAPIYFPSHLMERSPFPVSAPTSSKYLDKTSLPAIVVRLRLFIDSNGKVMDIKFMFPENLDAKTSQDISEMFYATTFVPGNIHGIDLPSYMDIELDLVSYIE